LWDPIEAKESRVLRGHKDTIRCLAYSPSGAQLASGSMDKTVRLWDPVEAKESQVLKGHTEAIWCLAYSPSGAQLASGSSDQTMRLWDAQSGNCLLVWRAPAPITQLLWRSDTLFIGCDNGIVAALQCPLPGHWRLAWLQSGRLPKLDFSD